VSLQSQSTAATLRSEASLKGVLTWRQLRAEVAAREREVDRLKQRLDAISAPLRGDTSSHPRGKVRPQGAPRVGAIPTQRVVDSRKRDIADARRKQAEVKERILHARRVLVTEAFSIFGICERAGMRTIAGLAIPPPEDLRREWQANWQS